jgi:hypothetical protein
MIVLYLFQYSLPQGGMIWLNATNMIEIDGRLSANAGNAISAYGGGGSGGSIWVYCRVFRAV